MRATFRKASGLALFGVGLFLQASGFQALFGVSYLRWYVENGSAIFLVVGVVSVALDWDKYPGCISADPYKYFEAWHELITNSFGELGAPFRERRAGWLTGARYLDLPLFVVFVAAWILTISAFLAVSWFAQYVLFLVCGAPARLMLAAHGDRPASGYAARPVTFTAAVGASGLYGLSRVL
jgi:hypothetical protein